MISISWIFDGGSYITLLVVVVFGLLTTVKLRWNWDYLRFLVTL